MLYLDNNATTQLAPEVVEQMLACERTGYMNPASQHRAGRRARQVVERARETVGRLLGADSSTMDADRVVFTSGGTEANNLALWGLVGERAGRVIISAIEHPSVVGAAERLRQRGHEVETLRVDEDGVVQLDHLRELLTDDTRLVSVMLANNETGVLQPVDEIAALCHEAGVPLHTDAVQVAGKLPVRFRALGVTAMTVAAHKFHGPRGIGALVLRGAARLEPLLVGGFQQAGMRAGTESVSLAVGMAAALELWQREADERRQRMTELRERFERLLRERLPEVMVHGSRAARLPHTTNAAFPPLDRQAMWMALDLAGIACSTGSACASGSSEPSPVLQAMGLPEAVVEASLRFSLGAYTTADEVDEAAERIGEIYKDLRNRKESGKLPATSRPWVQKSL